MSSSDAPAHEIVPVDEQTPDLLAECMKLRMAGRSFLFFSASGPYPDICSVFVDEQRFDPECEVDKCKKQFLSASYLL